MPSWIRALALAPLVVGAAACGDSEEEVVVDGVEVVEDLTNDHVEGDVDYPDDPPAGGDHDPVWLNCGFYDEPKRTEHAVHSLEHGVVWLAHEPDLPDDEIAELRKIYDSRPDRLIVSPYPGIDSPVVAVAWGRRLAVESASDPRLEQFVENYVNGTAAPEPGAACEGGVD